MIDRATPVAPARVLRYAMTIVWLASLACMGGAQYAPYGEGPATAGSPPPEAMALRLVPVPSLLQLSYSDAAARTAQAGLKMSFRGPSDGTVNAQYPAAGTRVGVGSTVSVALVMNTPPSQPLQTPIQPQPEPEPQPQPIRTVAVPGLLKRDRTVAVEMLVRAGLRPGNIRGPADGVVTAEFPAAGTQVPRGTAVDLVLAVSILPNPTPAPQSWFEQVTGRMTRNPTITVLGLLVLAGLSIAALRHGLAAPPTVCTLRAANHRTTFRNLHRSPFEVTLRLDLTQRSHSLYRPREVEEVRVRQGGFHDSRR